MSYITREDGEHFVIPSYRDVLMAKQKSALKKEIILLSQSYGEYITLQRKGPSEYEVAFSPDTGYLLGESVWHHFGRPQDMIYCEAVPNTTEVILVIVKAGSVYLDGSFPYESIPEELVIFLTQQNNFEIYTYGNVPISEVPEEGKFSFEASSVKSFTVLDGPVFSTLPLIKQYQLQLVDAVLKAHGIGVFPTRQILAAVIILGTLWLAWSYLVPHREALPQVVQENNPYAGYNQMLTTPAPDQEIKAVLENIQLIYTVPGWQPGKFEYIKGNLNTLMISSGGTAENLFKWAANNKASINIVTTGMYVVMEVNVPNRPVPKNIYPLKQVVAELVDRVATVYPGNNLRLEEFSKTADPYTHVQITIQIIDVLPGLLSFIGDQLKDLPLVLKSMTLTVNNGALSGSIIIEAAGS